MLLFANDIGTPLAADPDLMHLVCVDIPPCAGAYGLSFGVWVVGIGIGYGAVEDEMGCFGAVLVRRVVCIAAPWSMWLYIYTCRQANKRCKMKGSKQRETIDGRTGRLSR